MCIRDRLRDAAAAARSPGLSRIVERAESLANEDALLAPWRDRWTRQGLGHVLRVPTHVGALGTADDLMALCGRVAHDGARTTIHGDQEDAL